MHQTRRLSSAEFRFVEHKLYTYLATKQLIAEYEAQREELMNATKTREEGMPGSGALGRPTETTAIQLALLESKVKPEMFWVKAIEDTLELLCEEDRRLVELKYFEAYLSNTGIARQLNISEREFYNRREQIVYKFAYRFGLI